MEKKSNCIVVNLAGPPGSGKSTAAAYIFARLKMQRINAELITEYAKRKVWEENNKAIGNQTYLFGQQYYSMLCCEDKVDVIVTDSPLFLSVYYNQENRLGQPFNEVVWNVFQSYHNQTFLLKRVQPYEQSGRIQTAEESDAIYYELKELMDEKGIEYETLPGNTKSYDRIVEKITAVLRNKT